MAAPLREQVSDLLRREIVEMRLRPGQRLVERELIKQIGVSRTTIREALRELAAEGLVTTIPQKGAIVAIPSPKEAAEVYEVRALLEGLAAREFARNASAAHWRHSATRSPRSPKPATPTTPGLLRGEEPLLPRPLRRRRQRDDPQHPREACRRGSPCCGRPR